MTEPIREGAYQALNTVFTAFNERSNADQTVQDVVMKKVHQIKETFQTDFENDFRGVQFFQTKKISELTEKEKGVIQDVFSRLLRQSPEILAASSPSTVSVEDEEAFAIIEEPLRKSKLTLDLLKREGLHYEEKMRAEANLPWAKGEMQLEPVSAPVVEDPRLVSFMPGLLDVLDDDIQSQMTVEGMTVPNLFIADHLGSRKNRHMQLGFSTEQEMHKISTTQDAVAYVESVENFVDEITTEETSKETKDALRSSILIYSSQQTANGLASGYASNQTMFQANMGIDGFVTQPTSSMYRFEPVLNEKGEIVPEQFKVIAQVHMSTFRMLRTEETLVDQEAFARKEKLAEAREKLGVGEVIGADIRGRFIVFLEGDLHVKTKGTEVNFSLVMPPVRDAYTARRVIEEVLDPPTKEEIQEESRVCQDAIRRELEFSPGATQRRIAFSPAQEVIVPILEDLEAFQAGEQSAEESVKDVEFSSVEKKETAEKLVQFLSSDREAKMIGASYTSRIAIALGSINEDSFKTNPRESQCTIAPQGIDQFQVYLRVQYETQKEIKVDTSRADPERVREALRWEFGSVATGEVQVSFTVTIGENGAFTGTGLQASCLVTVGGALDEFVDIEEE